MARILGKTIKITSTAHTTTRVTRTRLSNGTSKVTRTITHHPAKKK